MKLKIAKIDDLKSIAKCRKYVSPDSLGSILGKRYLRKILETFIVHERYFLFYVEEHNECVGYCAGCLDTIEITGLGSTSSMVHHAFWEGVLSLMIRPWLFFHTTIISRWPFIIKKIFERMKKKELGKYYVVDKKNNEIKSVWLVDIGVHPDYRRCGIGSKLLDEFDNRVKELGLLKGTLSVKNANHGAIKMYKKHGWEITQVRQSACVMTKYYSN